MLSLKGSIEKFATIDPPRVLMRGRSGDDLAAEVCVIPREDEPFDVRSIRPRMGTDIRAEFERRTVDGSRHFIVRIFSTRGTKGRYSDVVDVRTTSPKMPILRIPVTGILE